ncbi:hypothetical protein EYF80_022550 [Liparis tanakae]|uniref:Uncharacterized protein n=1 Tax=Liparis tanakae TaxID=230148 RepID=A0A4Z2HR04_9TELE|nr:hypothetical protein EYF80_022550 [Liparis tanakae]
MSFCSFSFSSGDSTFIREDLPQADLLLTLPLPGVQQDIQGTPLGDKPLGLVPECSLSCAQELEEVAALSWTQKLRMLRNKALDIKCGIL